MTIGPGIIPGFSYLCRWTDNYLIMPLRGCVVKRGRVSFLPGMAIFKPFSGLFRCGWYNLSFLLGNAVKSKIREK